jgi:hypothetical protein
VERKVHEVPEPRRPYASASDTPSSHLREWCEAGTERARCWRSATDAGRTGAQKGCRRAQSFWDMESQNVSRARRHSLKLLTGKAPRVIRALRFSPRKVQRGLRAVAVAGNPDYRVDPRRDDFYRCLIDLRSVVKSERDIAEAAGEDDGAAALDTEQGQLKITANATSYGIFIELNVVEETRLTEVTCFGAEGVGFSTRGDERGRPRPLLPSLGRHSGHRGGPPHARDRRAAGRGRRDRLGLLRYRQPGACQAHGDGPRGLRPAGGVGAPLVRRPQPLQEQGRVAVQAGKGELSPE